MFGYDVFTSSLIVFTKYSDLIPRKQEELKEKVVKGLKIPYVYWDSKYELPNQLDSLMFNLFKIKPFVIPFIKDLERDIELQAQDLQSKDLVLKEGVNFTEEHKMQYFEFTHKEDSSLWGIVNILTIGKYKKTFLSSGQKNFELKIKYENENSYDRKIKEIDVNYEGSDECVDSVDYHAFGVGRSDGDLQSNFMCRLARLGYSSVIYKINVKFSYKVPKEWVGNIEVPRHQSHLPYMEEARRKVLKEKFN